MMCKRCTGGPGRLTLHAGDVREGKAMDEAEGLPVSDPGPMLKFLRHPRPPPQPLKAARRSKRKIGLFICACYHRDWSNFSQEIRALVNEYERYSDGIVTWAAVERAYWA